MRQKTALLVGATAGIGKETAGLLAQAGYQVIVVGRNQVAGETVAANLRGQFIQADMSLMSETRRVADVVKAQVKTLDTIVHTADALVIKREETAEGFEKSLATNYLSRFLLNGLLHDLLRNGQQPRIVHVAAANMPLTLTEANFPLPATASSFMGHNVGQAANDYYGLAFAERYRDEGIRINILNPGIVDTDIRRRGNGGPLLRGLMTVMEMLMRPVTQTPASYARLVAAIATGEHPVADQSVLVDRKGKAMKPRADRLDQGKQQYVWTQSEQLAGSRTTINQV